MKNITAILDKLLLIAKDVKIWFRILVLVITGFVGAIAFSRTKTKTDKACEEERAKLITFITEMRMDLSEPTSYVPASMITFASYVDTMPQQTKIQKWSAKMDSLLRKHKQDSLKKLKQ